MKSKFILLLLTLFMTANVAIAGIGVPEVHRLKGDKLEFDIIEYIGEKPSKNRFAPPSHEKILVHTYALDLSATELSETPEVSLINTVEVDDIENLQNRYYKPIEGCRQVNYRQETTDFFLYDCADRVVLENRESLELCEFKHEDVALLIAPLDPPLTFKRLRNNGDVYYYNFSKEEEDSHWMVNYAVVSCDGIKKSKTINSQLDNRPMIHISQYADVAFRLEDSILTTDARVVDENGDLLFTEKLNIMLGIFEMKAYLPHLKRMVRVKGVPNLRGKSTVIINVYDLLSEKKIEQRLEI